MQLSAASCHFLHVGSTVLHSQINTWALTQLTDKQLALSKYDMACHKECHVTVFSFHLRYTSRYCNKGLSCLPAAHVQ